MTAMRVRSRRWPWIAASLCVPAALYAGSVAVTWWTYGRHRAAAPGDADPWLDRFIPDYDVADRRTATIDAPADTTLEIARTLPLLEAPVVRGLIVARERLLGATGGAAPPPGGLLASLLAIGWGVLADVPGEIVVGAVTKPWEADVTFRALPAAEFRRFAEPGWVKIAWTLRADPRPDGRTTFRTETRVATTDPGARATFRRYWACLSPGIAIIRLVAVRQLRSEAARRAASVSPGDRRRAGRSAAGPR